MQTDLDIARSIPMRDIANIAAQLGLSEDQFSRYGKYKAKLPLSLIQPQQAAKG